MIYNEVILDSALFKKPLSQNAKSFIGSNRVVMSSTFFSEVRSYTELLRGGYYENLTENLSTIVSMLHRGGKIIQYSQPFDVRQRAVKLSENGYKVCVITEDKLLIERLLTSSAINVDVYDLNKDMISPHMSYKNTFCTVDKKTSSSKIVSGIKNGTKLDTREGFCYTLGERLSEDGIEGYIYHVQEREDLVVKIYKTAPSHARRIHLERLLLIGKEIKAPWCAFPENLLYYKGELIGFTMPKIESVTMSEDSLYLGDDEDIEEDRLNKRLDYQVKYCLALLTQIKLLNCFGISLPDFNDANFSVYTEKQPVVFYDADSFIYGSYFGNTIDDPAFSRQYDLTNKESLSLMCEENALKMVFRILSLGMYPFGGEGQPYQFNTEANEASYRRQYFFGNVLNRMDDVFSAKELPSICLMLNDLKNVETYLENEPQKNITIRQMRDTALMSIGITDTPTVSSAQPPIQPDTELNIEPENQTKVKAKAKRKGMIAAWAATLSIITTVVIWVILATVIK